MPELTPKRATVVTPVYNAQDFVTETVDSILEQIRACSSDIPIEYIVVDDGSTDDTAELLTAQYGNEICLIRQENQGEVAAVNRGVAEAASDIVGVVNADDPIRPGLLKSAISRLEANADLVAVYPDWDMIDADGGLIQTMRTYDFDLRVHLEQHLCLPGPGAFFRKSALAGEPARDSRFPLSSDYEMWLRLALAGRIERIPEVLATWRMHSGGTSQSVRSRRMAESKIGMIHAFYGRADLPAEVRAWRRQALASAYYCAGLLAIHGSDVPGRRYMALSIALSPIWPSRFKTERSRSWIRVLYVLFQPLSRWLLRGATASGLLERRL